MEKPHWMFEIHDKITFFMIKKYLIKNVLHDKTICS